MSDISDFMTNRFNFGEKPLDYPLDESQKKLAALAMAVNAALIQFVLEGILPVDQQLHFMGHLQDYANRIYDGKSIKLDDVKQTLQINSKAGNLFYEAAEEALRNGSKNFEEMKNNTRQMIEKLQTEAETNGDPDLAKSRTLN